MISNIDIEDTNLNKEYCVECKHTLEECGCTTNTCASKAHSEALFKSLKTSNELLKHTYSKILSQSREFIGLTSNK